MGWFNRKHENHGKITASNLHDLFHENVTSGMAYTEARYLFDDDGVFDPTNFNSGADKLIKEYANDILSINQIGGSYNIVYKDEALMIIGVYIVNHSMNMLAKISWYESRTCKDVSLLFDIIWDSDKNSISTMNCNNEPCKEEDYLKLLNFINNYGLTKGPFGRIVHGGAFDNVTTSESEVIVRRTSNRAKSGG